MMKSSSPVGEFLWFPGDIDPVEAGTLSNTDTFSTHDELTKTREDPRKYKPSQTAARCPC